MQVLLDTSVLVAALVQSHPHHHSAIKWLDKKNKISLMVAAHTLAETYAVLTRLPLSPKISPEIAYRLLHDNLPQLGKTVSLGPQDYIDIIAELSLSGLSGGIVYDAIILKTAQKNHADKLVTFNLKHFLQICTDKNFIVSAEEFNYPLFKHLTDD